MAIVVTERTRLHSDKWLKIVMVMLLVFAAWNILQIILHFFNPPGQYDRYDHHYDDAIVIAAIINTLLFIGLAYSLKVAHDQRRPALFIPFLVLNLIAIIIVGATLVHGVLGLLNRDPLVADRAAGNAKNMASTMTATHRYNFHDFEAPFVTLVTAIIFGILILFEYVVYRAWVEVGGGGRHHLHTHQPIIHRHVHA